MTYAASECTNKQKGEEEEEEEEERNRSVWLALVGSLRTFELPLVSARARLSFLADG